MPPTQMNIRIDQHLKQTGDSIIARSGYSPSQVVRAVWEYAAINEHLPKAIVHQLEQQSLNKQAESELPDDAVRRGAALVTSFYEEMGIPQPTSGPIDYEKLRESAAREQMTDWGLS